MRALRFVSVVMFVCLVAPLACKRDSAPAPQTKPAPAPPPAAAPPAAAAPFRVSSVTVGNAIGADKKVVAPASRFVPSDTIYASVATEGASPSAALSVRWTYEDGQLVNQESQTIAPTGPATSEFHISKPDGFPEGKYKVEIALNGAPVGSQEFEVRATN